MQKANKQTNKQTNNKENTESKFTYWNTKREKQFKETGMFGDDALGIADSFIKEVKTLYIIRGKADSFRVFYIFYIIWGQDCENNVYNV